MFTATDLQSSAWWRHLYSRPPTMSNTLRLHRHCRWGFDICQWICSLQHPLPIATAAVLPILLCFLVLLIQRLAKDMMEKISNTLSYSYFFQSMTTYPKDRNLQVNYPYRYDFPKKIKSFERCRNVVTWLVGGDRLLTCPLGGWPNCWAKKSLSDSCCFTLLSKSYPFIRRLLAERV